MSLKCLYHSNSDLFCKKKRFFFCKKGFFYPGRFDEEHFFEKAFLTELEAGNMMVVAGCLVLHSLLSTPDDPWLFIAAFLIDFFRKC